MASQLPAIRTRVWLADRLLSRDPVPVTIAPTRFEKQTRTSNLGLRVDRPTLLPRLPNIRNRHTITLPWSTIMEPSILEHVDALTAKGQPFDLGLWKQTYDFFDGDGTTKTFYLQRRLLIPTITPPVEWTDYPTRVVTFAAEYGTSGATPTDLTVVPKTFATIATGDPASGEAWVETDGHQVGNNWVSIVRVNAAPGDYPDAMLVIYLPLYSVVIEQEGQRSYGRPMEEPRSLRLAEIG